MRLLSKTQLKKLALIGLIPSLTACAFAPGMRMDQRHVADMVETGDISALKKITPEFLKSEQALRAQQASPDLGPLIGKASPYLIGAGDILSIVVWDHPELSTPAMTGTTTLTPSGNDSGAALGFVVDRDGLVQFPIVGPIRLAGLTEVQARNLLSKKLASFLKNPDLTLRVQAYRSQRIYLDGEVKMPGGQAINDVPMTLLEAITRAGGFLPAADQSRVQVTRGGISYQVNIPQLVQKGIDPASILLKNGDVVRVISREESKIFVLGEATKPLSLPMRNGRLTLNEALGDSLGVNSFFSDPQQVYVVRNVPQKRPEVYHLDARTPVALALAENFELQPKDVVYVGAHPLALWNRVISLLLPSAQVINIGKDITND